uniref:Uncharacterized protein n=1 Tax=Kalanchoe fedtschenkoi TaxID=63787 RepID=A0A7N0ZZR8_KALFE
MRFMDMTWCKLVGRRRTNSLRIIGLRAAKKRLNIFWGERPEVCVDRASNSRMRVRRWRIEPID